jgi:phytanoyl-CoA hydroxylase
VVTEDLFRLIAHHLILDELEPIMGPEIEASGGIAVRPKLPHDKRTTVLWHQDSNYFGPDSESMRMLSVWLPLVPVNEANGCIQVIPGSHRHGYQESVMDPEYQAQRPVEDPTRFGAPVSCEMAVGDVLIFTNLTFHRSLMNVSDHTRWSIDLRYYPTATEFARKGDFMPGFVARSADPAAADSWSTWWAAVRAHPYYDKMKALGRVAA